MQQLFSQKKRAPYIPIPKGRGFTAHLVTMSTPPFPKIRGQEAALCQRANRLPLLAALKDNSFLLPAYHSFRQNATENRPQRYKHWGRPQRRDKVGPLSRLLLYTKIQKNAMGGYHARVCIRKVQYGPPNHKQHCLSTGRDSRLLQGA